MVVFFISMSTLLPNSQHCYFLLGNRVDGNRVDKHGFLHLISPHTLLRSYLQSYSSSRVHFVWISFLLYNIVVTELT